MSLDREDRGALRAAARDLLHRWATSAAVRATGVLFPALTTQAVTPVVDALQPAAAG